MLDFLKNLTITVFLMKISDIAILRIYFSFFFQFVWPLFYILVKINSVYVTCTHVLFIFHI